ncbi:MAG TPA: PadR family transcriptional regulator [Ktedonobacteraceae bacterium]|jgi:DNA-binding PadR family transcriptional regulator|nr:PadR family transcriptional regulator [Ktedonobacteraceae bacterium]
MYEFIILSLLMRMPMHAYLIMKITNDQIGPWAKISSGTLSTMLNKLEQTGLIAPLQQRHDYTKGERRSRTFTITEEGRKRFHQLMMDTSSNLGDYQKVFYHKMSYFDLLRSDERLLLVNHYLNYCQITMLHVQTEMNNLVHELANYPAFLQNLLRMMKHVVQHWQAEYEWIKDIREQELEQAEAANDTGSNG